MLNNQTSKTTNASSFVKQDVLGSPLTELDSLAIDKLLEQLDEEETKQQNDDEQKTSSFLTKEIVVEKEPLLVDKEIENQKTLKETIPTETRADSQQQTVEAENSKIKFTEILESVKKAKLNYEKLEQGKDEKTISNVQSVETYLNWVKESRKLLKECVSKEDQESVSVFIPKRIQKQIQEGTAPPFILNDSGKASLSVEQNPPSILSPSETNEGKPTLGTDKESVLNERIRKLEERIKKLDQERPEYVEELIPLETKKSLVKEEIESKKDEASTEIDGERQKQELSTQKLISKQSFKNKAPVVQPKKEERERLKKAELAEEIEKEEEIPIPFYSAEQLDVANEIRVTFHKKLISLGKSEWYKSPSINRDFVNKQIIQVSSILSGKDSIDIDMNDIQTARIFMFNEAPKEILKHPSFYYVESFYNYQSSQGCLGINAEEIFSKQENPDFISKNYSDVEKGRFFIEQVSPQKDNFIQENTPKKTEEENSKEEGKESDVLENTILE